MLIPPIVEQFKTTSKKDYEVRIAALKTIDIFCDDLQLTEFSNRIIRALAETIDNNASDKVCCEFGNWSFWLMDTFAICTETG